MDVTITKRAVIDASKVDLEKTPEHIKVYDQYDRDTSRSPYCAFAIRITDSPFIVKIPQSSGPDKLLYGERGDFLIQHNDGKLESDPFELENTPSTFEVLSTRDFIGTYRPWSPDPIQEDVKETEMNRPLLSLRKNEQ